MDSQHAERTPQEWEHKWREENAPGPAWAWGISYLPLIGWIGDAVITVANWRRRRSKSTKDT